MYHIHYLKGGIQPFFTISLGTCKGVSTVARWGSVDTYLPVFLSSRYASGLSVNLRGVRQGKQRPSCSAQHHVRLGAYLCLRGQPGRAGDALLDRKARVSDDLLTRL